MAPPLSKHVFGRSCTAKRSKAFSLLELLIVFSIVAILLVLAAPDFKKLQQQNQTSVIVNRIVNALHYARTEAIKRNALITFSKKDTWRNGQIILMGKKQLRVFPALPKGDQLIWRSSFGHQRNNYLQFTPSGFTNGQQGHFSYMHAGQELARVVVGESGKVVLHLGTLRRC